MHEAALSRAATLFQNMLALQEPDHSLLPESLQRIADKVEAKLSPRHGVGVFASRKLKAETLASLYPVHSMGIGDFGMSTDEDMDYFQALHKNRQPSPYRLSLLHPSIQEWAPGLWVDANPHCPIVPGWTGHLANDAAVCGGSSGADALKYQACCELECNSVLIPFGDAVPVMALCPVRDIEPGEELLVSYGHTFWMQQLGQKVEADNDDDAESWARVHEANDRQGRLMARIFDRVAAAHEVTLREIKRVLEETGETD